MAFRFAPVYNTPMKLSFDQEANYDAYWLYVIECIPTGQKYVGQTGKPNPCWRWSDHVLDLRLGKHKSELFQIAWNTYPCLTQWQFRAIDRAAGKRAANLREADLILAIPVEMRLNSKKTSTVSLARLRNVQEMLLAGRKYIDIRDEAGISLGMISKIRYRMAESGKISRTGLRQQCQ